MLFIIYSFIILIGLILLFHPWKDQFTSSSHPWISKSGFDQLISISDTIIAPAPSLLTKLEKQRKTPLTKSEKDFLMSSASQLDVAYNSADLIYHNVVNSTSNELKLSLILFSNPVICALLFGGTTSFKGFAGLNLNQREKVLLSLSKSMIPKLRAIFISWKKIVCAVMASSPNPNSPDGTKTHPWWKTLGWKPEDSRKEGMSTRDWKELPTPTLSNTIHSISSNSPRLVTNQPNTQPSGWDTELCPDIIVIGSGSGGGTVVAPLCEAGFKVLLIEKAGYASERDFTWEVKDSLSTLYEASALLPTADANMVILAGSTLGGGSTINWSASFTPPDWLRKEWAQDHGLTRLDSKEFTDLFEPIKKRMNIHVEGPELVRNISNNVISEGCEKLGFDIEDVARNTKGCRDCSYCTLGCIYGAKQGTMKTYIQDAADTGNLTILTYTEVDQVIHKNGLALGVLAKVNTTPTASPKDRVHKWIKIRSRLGTVVVSAGSIHSPAILLRSKISNPNIGKNLYLHPVTAVLAQTDGYDKAEWNGAPITVVSNEKANQDGSHYGVKFEGTTAQLPIIAVASPWLGYAAFKELFIQAPSLYAPMAICRDKETGQITIDTEGRPIVNYSVSSIDRKHLATGIRSLLQVLKASGGVSRAITSFDITRPLVEMNDEQGFNDLLDSLDSASQVDYKGFYFSAHQMGTCRMGTSSSKSVVNPDGQSHDIKGLWVADASICPTSTGVNPMITTVCLSYFVANNIIKSLK